MRISFAVAAALAGLARLSDQQVSAIPVHQDGGTGDLISMSIRDDVYDPDETRPTQYYMPAHPLHHDPSDFAHLKPQTSGQLYYTKDGSSDHRQEHEFALLVNSYQHPTVVLEHSHFVDNVGCTSSGQLQVTLNDPEAFEWIRSNWKKKQMLVTHTHGCLPSTIPEEHSYWLVDKLDYQADRLVVVASGKQVPIETAIGYTDVKWGTHLPYAKRAGGIPEEAATGAVSQPTLTVPDGAVVSTAVVTESIDYAALATATIDEVTAPTGTATCPAAPAATVRGLPTAPLCDDFDLLLDDSIGYFDFEDEEGFSTALQEFIPGLDDYSYDSYDGLEDTAEIVVESLRRRAGLLEKIASGTKKMVKQAGTAVTNGARATGAGIQRAAQVVKQVPRQVKAAAVATVRVVQEATKVDKSFPLNGLDVNFNTSTLAALENNDRNTTLKGLLVKDTIWGRGARMFDAKKRNVDGTINQLSVNCVGCGIATSTRLHGHLILNLAGGGLEKAEVSFGGNMSASLAVAIEGSMAWDKDFIDKELFVIPTPLGFGVANVFRVGLTAGAKTKLNGEIKLVGGVLIGGGAEMTNFEIKADLAKRTASIKNAVPKVYGKFDAVGQVGVTVGLSFPFDVGVGLTIPPVKLDRKLALVIEPVVEGGATLHLASVQAAECAGVKGEITAKIKVAGDFFKVKELKLFEYAYKAFEGCLTYKESAEWLQNSTRRVIGSRQESNSSAPDYFEVPTFEDDGTWEIDQSVLPDTTDEQFLDHLFGQTEATISTEYVDANLTSVVVRSAYDGSTFGTGEDGNFYLFANDELAESFGYQDGVIPATEEDELMFYYADSMATLGVSRMRYGHPLDVPVTADFLSLLAINNDGDASTPSLVLPTNTAGDAFFPVLCDYSDGQFSKFFLVNDIEAGVASLQSEELRYIVTGGIVSQCQYWELQTSAAGIEF